MTEEGNILVTDDQERIFEEILDESSGNGHKASVEDVEMLLKEEAAHDLLDEDQETTLGRFGIPYNSKKGATSVPLNEKWKDYEENENSYDSTFDELILESNTMEVTTPTQTMDSSDDKLQHSK